MAKKLWEGRFSEKTSESVEAFTASIDVDKRLYACDIAGSIAHCKTLAQAAVISNEDAETLIQGLHQVRTEIENGKFKFDNALEDIHMHIESRLYDIVGQVAHKLHTARSRNDQIALDMRMFLKEETHQIMRRLVDFQYVIINLAKVHSDVILPGYTHMQRAQPVLFSHHLMAYFEMFSRDIDRFEQNFSRLNVMPLGSAALAGTTYPINRDFTAQLLDFPEVSANSIDSVSDRDYILDFLSAASICMMHLSRLSEEIILWATSEFSFIEFADAFATGSSIMPQKKNPDVAELVRGKTGRVFGDLMALLTMMKALPLAYNRDMQEDKILLFNSLDTLSACIDIYIQMLPSLTIKKQAMEKAAASGFLNATDLADYLVGKGMSFREAHHCVGQAVGVALQQKKELHELSLEELQSFSALIQEDIFESLSLKQLIDRRTSFGGTASEQVTAAIKRAKQQLGKKSKRLGITTTKG